MNNLRVVVGDVACDWIGGCGHKEWKWSHATVSHYIGRPQSRGRGLFEKIHAQKIYGNDAILRRNPIMNIISNLNQGSPMCPKKAERPRALADIREHPHAQTSV
jgi:hypothetical protein